jgi:Galactose oxidase, central domain
MHTPSIRRHTGTRTRSRVWRSLPCALVVALLAPSPTALAQDGGAANSAEPAAADTLDWPQRRFAACGAYDDATSTMYVFGGRAEGGATHHGDAWALEAPDAQRPVWRLLSDAEASGGPPPTRSCSAVYDAAGERFIVFGGWDGSVMQNSVWALDVGGQDSPTPPAPEWTRLCDATSCGAGPSPRRASQMILDPRANDMVVFGGLDGVYRNDLWTLDLDGDPTWTRRSVTGEQPDARGGHSLTLDASRRRAWLVGGTSTGADYGDTWSLDLDTFTWTRADVACVDGCPPARSGATLVHDTGNDQLMFYGGWNSATNVYPPDVWALRDLDGVPTWHRVGLDSERPQPRYFHVSGFDSAQGRMVTFGGGSGGNAYKDTLALYLPVGGEAAWRGVQPTTLLTARDQVAVTFDEGSGRITAFGGFGSGVFPGSADAGTHLADTFQIRLGAGGRNQRWRSVTPTDPATVPIEREATAYATDPAAHRLYVVGGLTGDVELNDVWVVEDTDASRPQWRQLCSPTSCGQAPSQRWGGHAVFDAERQRLLVFGGRGAGGVALADTWELALTDDPTWRRITTSGPTPPARWGGAAMLDATGARLVVFGGQTGPDATGTTLGDTWALSLADNRWRRLDDGGVAPTARRSPAYTTITGDDGVSRLAVFGGLRTETATHHDDVWLLAVDGDTARWTQAAGDRCGDDSAPMCRRSASMVHDAGRGDLVITFGRDDTQFVDDLWRFDLERATWCREPAGGVQP